MGRTSRSRKQLEKKPRLEDDTSILPCDIIPDILSRLPVKSLMRFKSVSKPWNSLISDAKFARIHLLQSKNSECCEARALSRSYLNKVESHHLLKYTNKGVQFEGMLKFPVKQYVGAQALCSYDGLVVLKNTAKSDKRYVIWNPSTRTYIAVLCPYRFETLCVVGLCHDEAREDYKVLIIEDAQYVVFSFNNSSWTQRTYPSINHVICNHELVVVRGVPHWVVEEKCNELRLSESEEHYLELEGRICRECNPYLHHFDHFTNHPVYKCDYSNSLDICYLDHRDDTVKKLSKPASLDRIAVFRLISLRSHLCLYRNTYDLTGMEIWMMKEYGDPNSWTKLLMIENIPGPHVCYQVKPLCFTSEGDIVIEFDGTEFVIYNPRKNIFRGIESYCSRQPLLYLDSLILPRKFNGSKKEVK